ncbi:MAG: riboflavin synthase [Rhodospirillaceae bacterium]|nr:riboflavin synthase [Rhodospirillaceae bacterium]
MFTGIVTDLGQVAAVADLGGGSGDKRLRIATAFDAATVAIGASIACNGCCLTVVEKGAGWFAADVSNETLSKTTLGGWRAGTPVNLERALKVGDELGGHIVSGHVDGVGVVSGMADDGQSRRFTVEVSASLAPFIAAKGSVALDGVSLTVNEVAGRRFGVNVIPHTRAVTTFGSLNAGDRVNVEIDVLARYVARLFEAGAVPARVA